MTLLTVLYRVETLATVVTSTRSSQSTCAIEGSALGILYSLYVVTDSPTIAFGVTNLDYMLEAEAHSIIPNVWKQYGRLVVVWIE